MPATFLTFVALGCSAPQPSPEVDRIELRLSGWSAVEVEVNKRGEGKYHLSEPPPHGKDGSFSLQPRQFALLVARLRPFQRQAVPLTARSAQELIDRTCPQGVPFVTDAGAVWVHWTGPGLDRHYLADLGCDAKRNAARNKELLDALKSLPVPLGR
ncbi:MAG: hypothetical protein ACJ8EB_09215 [Allosphingosinicella sp.]